MTEKICVIGGDMRNIVAARELSKEGYEVCALGMEKAEIEGSDGITLADGIENAIGGAAVVLLPLPYSVDGETVNAPYSDKTITVKEVFELAGEETLICGGMMGSLSLKRNVIDYYDSEEFKILNAAATAESALIIGASKLKITVNGARASVLGYGRIGRLLALKLRQMGALVTVVTRKRSDAAWCAALGYAASSFKELDKALPDADIVFNTVPAVVMDADALKMLRAGTPVIDLASKPGGVDAEAAEALGVDAALYPGLPGKHAPYTVGVMIKNAVQRHIKKGK